MRLHPLTANCIEFPGRAGELERSGATAALFRELGDNYARYHAFLARELEASGGDPDPRDFRGDANGVGADPAAYGRQAALVQRLVASEVLLRRAWVNRRHGRPLGDPLTDFPPPFDADGRLVDIEHPERSRFSSRLTSPLGAPEFVPPGGGAG